MATHFDPIANVVAVTGKYNNILIKTRTGWDNATYGKEWLPSHTQKTIKWKFTLLAGKGGGVIFGVISNKEKNINPNQDPTGSGAIKYLFGPSDGIYDINGYKDKQIMNIKVIVLTEFVAHRKSMKIHDMQSIIHDS